MAARAKRENRLSFAGRDPALSRGTPDSLRDARPARPPFDHARCPYVSAQIKDAEKTEAQRRTESGRGSTMVRLHRPFPELRPKHERGPIKASFNQAWLKEQRAAQMARFQRQARANEQTIERSHAPADRQYSRSR